MTAALPKRRRTRKPTEPSPIMKTESMSAAYRYGVRAQQSGADWFDAEAHFERRSNAGDDEMAAWSEGWCDAYEGRVGHALNCPKGVTGVVYPDRPVNRTGHDSCTPST